MRSVVEKRSYGSVTVFWLDREAAVEAVRDSARRWAHEDRSVERIILFGSLARGTATAASDADVLVVLSATDVPLLDRPATFADRFADAGLPVELFVYTRDEVASRPSSIAEHALTHGMELV
jgi:uncharacterized protein